MTQSASAPALATSDIDVEIRRRFPTLIGPDGLLAAANRAARKASPVALMTLGRHFGCGKRLAFLPRRVAADGRGAAQWDRSDYHKIVHETPRRLVRMMG